MRRLAHRVLPLELRWRIRQARRCIADARAGVTFADRCAATDGSVHLVCRYALPLVCYPGQEQAFAAKRSNIALALNAFDGTTVAPGESLSFWRIVGRPTARRGYASAAALKDGVLTQEVGGAICFVSTLLYNIMLLSGMAIIERYCHSVDSYGDARYFELGRDAAVEYAYRDVRARNAHTRPLVVRTRLDSDLAVIEAWCAAPLDIAVALRVLPEDGSTTDVFAVRTVRTIALNGNHIATDDLGLSTYKIVPVS
jgi:vancomycin resistance protein VanW